MSNTLFKLLIGKRVVENTASKSIFRQFLDIASVDVIRLSVFKKHVYSVIIFYFQLIDTVHTLFGALNRWIRFGNVAKFYLFIDSFSDQAIRVALPFSLTLRVHGIWTRIYCEIMLLFTNSSSHVIRLLRLNAFETTRNEEHLSWYF